MLESLRPFTWAMGAVAAWSFGLLLLGLVGLGGRVGPHPPDLALAPTIPVLRFSESAARLGPPSDYLVIGERPLFQPDRRPAPVIVVNTEQTTPFEGVLSSVLLTAELRMAIFSENNGLVSKRVRLGDSIPGTAWRLVALEPRRAVLEGPEGQRTLDLRVFNGQGGQAPTPMSIVVDPKPQASAPVQSISDQTHAETRHSAEEQAQITAIRARIEARRAQLREQQVLNTNAPVTER